MRLWQVGFMKTRVFMLKLLKLSKAKNKTISPYIFIFLLALVFFYPVWLQGKVPLPLDALVGAHTPWIEVQWPGYPAGVPIKNQEITDAISQFYPWRSLVGEYWRAGKAPLWNPYMFSGTPFLATLHSAGLYPLNILYVVFSDINAWTLLVFTQILLAGCFMYLFLQYLRLGKTASLFGAIAFMFSGHMIAWLEFATSGHAGLWLPLLLTLQLKYFRSGDNKYFLAIPFVFFFIYTAGDFQVPFYVTLIYLFLAGYLFVKENLNVGLIIKSLLSLTFGVILSLPQLLPTIELFTRSVRADDPYIKEYFYGLMHWEKSATFLWPDFFGNVVTRNYWGKFGFHEYMPYVGTVTLIFSAYSFLTHKKTIEKFFWLLLLVSLLFLFPTPFAFIPYKLGIPGLGTSSASRIIFVIGFSLSTVSAYGFSKWTKKHDTSKVIGIVKCFIFTSIGVGAGLFSALYIMKSNSVVWEIPIYLNLKVALKNMIPSTALLIAVVGILYLRSKIRLKTINKAAVAGIILLLTLDMTRFAWKNTPFSIREFDFPTTGTIEFLQNSEKPFRIAGSGVPLNYFMHYGLSSAEGYDPIYPQSNAEWFSMVNFGSRDNPAGRYGEIVNFGSDLLDFANVMYIIDYKKNPSSKALSDTGVFAQGLEGEGFEKVNSEKRVFVFKNKDYLPKIWLSGDFIVVKDENNMADATVKYQSDDKIILTSYPGFDAFKNQVNYKVDSFSQKFNEIEFEVTTDRDSVLFLSESFYPGWKAYVDGVKMPIYRANHIFQAIPISQGVYVIKFIYDPLSFRIGVWLAMVVVVLLILIAIKKTPFRL
jgi:hypothetical protein